RARYVGGKVNTRLQRHVPGGAVVIDDVNVSLGRFVVGEVACVGERGVGGWIGNDPEAGHDIAINHVQRLIKLVIGNEGRGIGRVVAKIGHDVVIANLRGIGPKQVEVCVDTP